MKTALIINPKSASGNTMKMWAEVKTSLQRRIGAFEVFFTEHPHHAEKLVRELVSKNYERLILMGGDGTIHEVVNGLMDEDGKSIKPDITIGILNSGRGCDFIRSLDIPTDPLQAISKFVDMKVKPVDVGQIKFKEDNRTKTYYFINSFSYGLGGEVAKNVTRTGSILPPTIVYLTSSLMGVLRSEPFKAEVVINDKKTLKGEYVNMFLMNGQYSGSGMHWAPNGKVDDGKLDFILIEKMSKYKIMMMTPKVYAGTFLEQKEVFSEQVQKISIKANYRLWVETDGEVNRASELEVNCIPKAINFIV